MSERSNYRIIPDKLAVAGESSSYLIPLSLLERFVERLQSPNGVICVTVNFGIDPEGYKTIKGTLSVDLDVVCQRCMKPFLYRLESQFALACVDSEAEADALPEHLDPVVVSEDRTLDLCEVIEDEVILTAPIIFRHEDESCVQSTAVRAECSANPDEMRTVKETRKSLAILGDLLKKNSVKTGEEHGSSKKS